MALPLRWHIRYPGYIAAGNAGGDIGRIIDHALALPVPGGWPQNPKNFTDAHEKRLVKSMLAIANTRSQAFWDTIDQVDRWPIWVNGNNHRRFRFDKGLDPLSEKRKSFKLDKSGLPPAP